MISYPKGKMSHCMQMQTHSSLTVKHVHLRVIHSWVILQADLCTPIQVDPVPHQRTADTISAMKSVKLYYQKQNIHSYFLCPNKGIWHSMKLEMHASGQIVCPKHRILKSIGCDIPWRRRGARDLQCLPRSKSQLSSRRFPVCRCSHVCFYRSVDRSRAAIRDQGRGSSNTNDVY